MDLLDPISKVKQLFDIIKIPHVFSYIKHNGSVYCILKFNTNIFKSSNFKKKKEAQKDVCDKFISAIPICNICSNNILNKNINGIMKYYVKLQIQDKNFETNLYSKKDDAKKQALIDIINYFINNTIILDTKISNTNRIEIWQKNNLPDIKRKLGVDENIDNLLTVAFIHSSVTSLGEYTKEYINELLNVNMFDYERLEFLGDTILQVSITSYLFNKYDNDSPGNLTLKRQIYVKQETCNKYMVELDLIKYIIHRNENMRISPKIICDVFEAILGAIYIGYNNLVIIDKLMHKLVKIIQL
jgi:23S rRNA maturation mini-RNase III